MKDDTTVIRNYGSMLVDLVKVGPDGIVVVMPNYEILDEFVFNWKEMGILNEIMKHKVLFIETRDYVKTSLEVYKYKKACDIGRGAMFLTVARGKVAGKIKFENHYGRCVVMLGVPLRYNQTIILE